MRLARAIPPARRSCINHGLPRYPPGIQVSMSPRPGVGIESGSVALEENLRAIGLRCRRPARARRLSRGRRQRRFCDNVPMSRSGTKTAYRCKTGRPFPTRPACRQHRRSQVPRHSRSRDWVEIQPADGGGRPLAALLLTVACGLVEGLSWNCVLAVGLEELLFCACSSIVRQIQEKGFSLQTTLS